VKGVAWPTVQKVAQTVILAEGGCPNLQDRFTTGPVVPKLFRPFHPGVDLFDERLHVR
jgi:hypothetical protein